MAKKFDQNIGKKTQFVSGAMAAENGRKGGYARHEVRKEKRTLRELATLFGSLKLDGKQKRQMQELGIPDEEHTRFMQAVVSLFQKALKGDVSAFNAIRDLIGEKPIDRTQLEGSFDTRLEIGFVETGIDPVGNEEDVDV